MILSEKNKGYLATIVSTFIIGFSFILVKLSLIYATPLTALTHRYVIAFIAILPFAIWKRKELTFEKHEIPSLLLMALLYPILTFGFQIWGLSSITSSEAGIIQAVQPLLTMVIAFVLLREHILINQKLFALLSVAGVVFIFIMQGVSGSGNIFGYVLMLVSVTAMSIYVVLSRKFKARFSVFRLTFFCITIGALFFSLISIGQYILTGQNTDFFTPLQHPEYTGTILYLGVLSTLVTLALTNYSYARVEASKLGVFANFIPVIAILAGVTIAGDQLTWVHILGSLLIFIGIIGVNITKKKPI